MTCAESIPPASSPVVPNMTAGVCVAIETSSRVGSVAVGLGDMLRAEKVFSGPMRHAAELMPTLSELVRAIGRRPADITEVYVSIGPGSFTGVRIAVMVARSLTQALGCRLVAVPTTEVLAHNSPEDITGYVGVVLDAKRGQIFTACYQKVSAGDTPSEVPGTQPVAPPFIQVVAPTLGDPRTLLAPWPRPLSLLGEGIEYHREAIGDAGPGITLLPGITAVPRAAAVYALGRWRSRQGLFTDRENLVPLYLRLPEAQELWEKRHAAAKPHQ